MLPAVSGGYPPVAFAIFYHSFGLTHEQFAFAFSIDEPTRCRRSRHAALPLRFTDDYALLNRTTYHRILPPFCDATMPFRSLLQPTTFAFRWRMVPLPYVDAWRQVRSRIRFVTLTLRRHSVLSVRRHSLTTTVINQRCLLFPHQSFVACYSFVHSSSPFHLPLPS